MYLVVNAGNHSRKFCPVKVQMRGFKEGAERARLTDLDTGNSLPCQVEPSGGGSILTLIIEEMKKGQEKRFELRATEEKKSEVELQEVTGERLEVRIKGDLFTSYWFGKELNRPYLNPLIAYNGASMVRKCGAEGETNDHPWHPGVWTAHGDINGVNCWEEKGEYGRIVHQAFEKLTSGSAYARIKAKNYWVNHQDVKLLEEERDIIVYNLPKEGRIIDFKIKFTASEGKIVFGDTKEGGILAVRVTTSMIAKKEGKIENSYGAIGEGESWGRRAHWCDYSGPVKGCWSGISIFDYPDNLSYPTHWHVRNYGLMAANHFGISDFRNDSSLNGSYTLPAGKKLAYSYRLYLHEGDAQGGKVRDKYHDYVNPPKVRIE